MRQCPARCKLLTSCAQTAGGARWDLRLTAWLLWLAKHGSTFWKQYVQFLPKAIPCCSGCSCDMHMLPVTKHAIFLVHAPCTAHRNVAVHPLTVKAFCRVLPRPPHACQQARTMYAYKLQEQDMTCLINYSPEEQHELQWLAQEAAAQHRWAQDSHETLFSSQMGQLKSLQLADSLKDTLWAMSLVRSRTFSERVHSLCRSACHCARDHPWCT